MRLFNRLVKRGMYAVHDGEYAGGFFVYIKECNKGEGYALLMLPESEPVYVSRREINDDLKQRDIKFYRKLPKDVYDVCKANFKYTAERAGIYANRQSYTGWDKY